MTNEETATLIQLREAVAGVKNTPGGNAAVHALRLIEANPRLLGYQPIISFALSAATASVGAFETPDNQVPGMPFGTTWQRLDWQYAQDWSSVQHDADQWHRQGPVESSPAADTTAPQGDRTVVPENYYKAPETTTSSAGASGAKKPSRLIPALIGIAVTVWVWNAMNGSSPTPEQGPNDDSENPWPR